VPRPTVRPAGRLAWSYFLAVFAFFTASASRRSYYLLPVLPPAAVRIAALWMTPAEQLRPLARRRRTGGYAVLAVGTVAVVLRLALPPEWRPAPFDRLPPTPARPFAIAGGVACLAPLGVGFFRTRLRPFAAFAVALAGVGYATVIAVAAADQYRTRRAFADAVRARRLRPPRTVSRPRHRVRTAPAGPVARPPDAGRDHRRRDGRQGPAGRRSAAVLDGPEPAGNGRRGGTGSAVGWPRPSR